jgi:hypothetical protein
MTEQPSDDQAQRYENNKGKKSRLEAGSEWFSLADVVMHILFIGNEKSHDTRKDAKHGSNTENHRYHCFPSISDHFFITCSMIVYASKLYHLLHILLLIYQKHNELHAFPISKKTKSF